MGGEDFQDWAPRWDFGMNFDFPGSYDITINDEASPGRPRGILHQLPTPESSLLNSNHLDLVANLAAQQQPYGAAFSLGAHPPRPLLGIRSPTSEHSYSSLSSSSTLVEPPSSIPNSTNGASYRQQVTCTPPHNNSRSASEIPFQVNQYDPDEPTPRVSRARKPSGQRGQRRSALSRDQVAPIVQSCLLVFLFD